MWRFDEGWRWDPRVLKLLQRLGPESLAVEATPEQEARIAALDAARARLRGGERPTKGQMTLDLRGR